MSRYRASLIHLTISAILVGSVIGLIYWVWYPEPTLEVVGALPIILLLVSVDLVIGPLLTLIVYKHGKPGLKFDLSVIATLQVIALVYGSLTLYEEKPEYLVFVVDRLEFVSDEQIDLSTLQFDASQTELFAKLTPVFAKIPEDPGEYKRYMDSVMDGAPDLESRPEYWAPWSSGAADIRERVKPLQDFKTASRQEEQSVKEAIDDYAEAHPNLGVLPIGGIDRNIGMLLDRDTLEILGVLNADPWPSE